MDIKRIKSVTWKPGFPFQPPASPTPFLSADRLKYRRPWIKQLPLAGALSKFISVFPSRFTRSTAPHVTAPWWGVDQQTLTQTFWTPDESNEAVTPLLPNTWFASQQVHKGDAYSDLVSKYLVDQKQTFDTKAGTRTIKVRLFPDAPQRKVLDQAFCAYRTTRATCVRWIRQHQRHAESLVQQPAALNPLKMLLRSKFMTATLESGKNPFFSGKNAWMLKVSKEIRESAVSDAVAALKTCLTNRDRGHQKQFDIKIKQQTKHGSFGIEQKITFRDDKLTFQFRKMFKDYKASSTVRCPARNLPFTTDGKGVMHPMCDCKIHRSSDGEHYLLATYSFQKDLDTLDQRPVMAGDLGVRKFLSSYSLDGTTACIGIQTKERLLPLIRKRDKIVSLMKKNSVRSRERRKLRASLINTKNKLTHLRDELHFKLIVWITSKHSVAVIPRLRVKQLTSRMGVLHSTTKKLMAVLGHGRFYQRLEAKCSRSKTVLVNGDEGYTSKACDKCGRITDVGSKEVFRCETCGNVADRDIHAARNILLKNSKIYHLGAAS